MSTSGTGRATPTPSVPMTQRQATITDGKVKVAATDLFHGDRDKLYDWLMQLQLFSQFQDEKALPREKRTLFATTYMRGNAFKWIKPYVAKHLARDNKNNDLEDIDEWMNDFSRFKIEIEKILGPSNEEKVA
ncbi:MAG: leucine zipper, down-regulated in cancer 1, partial [Watsoniomyces obsoletus]